MILRHRAKEFDLELVLQGYVDMVNLLKLHDFHMHAKTSALFHYVVEQNPKGRFDFMVEDPIGSESSSLLLTRSVMKPTRRRILRFPSPSASVHARVTLAQLRTF